MIVSRAYRIQYRTGRIGQQSEACFERAHQMRRLSKSDAGPDLPSNSMSTARTPGKSCLTRSCNRRIVPVSAGGNSIHALSAGRGGCVTIRILDAGNDADMWTECGEGISQLSVRFDFFALAATHDSTAVDQILAVALQS